MNYDIASFLATVGIVSETFWPMDNRMMGRERGGDINVTANGAQLWTGSVSVRLYRPRTVNSLAAKLLAMIQTDGTFIVCPPDVLDVAPTYGTLTSISAADRRIITVNGFASPGVGSYIGIQFDGERRSIHQVVAVNGSALTVLPPLPRPVATGSLTTYGRPGIRAIMNRDGISWPNYGTDTVDGLSFKWTQTMKRPQ